MIKKPIQKLQNHDLPIDSNRHMKLGSIARKFNLTEENKDSFNAMAKIANVKRNLLENSRSNQNP